MTQVKIVLVDDHRLLREGLRSLLEREADLAVVGEAGDARTAIECLEQLSPEVLVLDIALPDENGLQLARKLLLLQPELNIIILSADCDGSLVDNALHIGAKGYLCKEEAMSELVRAIRNVVTGKSHLSPCAATALSKYLNTLPASSTANRTTALSRRESEVLKLIVDGLRNKEIADRLGVGTKSVETYRARLMAKTHCSSPAALVKYALQNHLLEP